MEDSRSAPLLVWVQRTQHRYDLPSADTADGTSETLLKRLRQTKLPTMLARYRWDMSTLRSTHLYSFHFISSSYLSLFLSFADPLADLTVKFLVRNSFSFSILATSFLYLSLSLSPSLGMTIEVKKKNPFRGTLWKRWNAGLFQLIDLFNDENRS